MKHFYNVRRRNAEGQWTDACVFTDLGEADKYAANTLNPYVITSHDYTKRGADGNGVHSVSSCTNSKVAEIEATRLVNLYAYL